MEPSEINPFPRTAGYFEEWTYENPSMHVSYDLRIFAFVGHPALVALSGGRSRMPANSILILAPGEAYDFRNADPDAPFSLFCISFDLTQEYRDSPHFRFPVNVQNFQPEYLIDQKIRSGERDISDLHLPRIVRSCPEICDRVRLVYRIFQEKPVYYLEQCSGIVKSILFASLPESGETGTEQKPARGVLQAQRTMRYIKEHFREPINARTIAAAQNYHPYHLTRLTERYFGVTPYQYLMQCRIEEAVRLLIRTEKTVGDIASECGFANLPHFCSVIRRKTGLSPGEIRKNDHE